MHGWKENDVIFSCVPNLSVFPNFLEDKMVFFGGYYCSPDMEVESYSNDVFVLNIALMEWVKPTVEGKAPPPRSAHTANFVKGKMHVFGGLTTNM